MSNDYLKGHRQRLRDKFMNHSPSNLNDYEILEMLLFYIYPRIDVKIKAKEIMHKFNNFKNLLHNVDNDPNIDINHRLLCLLKLFKEIYVRSSKDVMQEAPVINNWKTLEDYCQSSIGNSKTEIFKILYLDSKNKLIKDETQDNGTIDQIAIYTREVVKKSLYYHAYSIILVHNHPSGNCKPSQADINITNKIKSALQYVDIKLLDHLIVTHNKCYSFHEHGLI